MKHNFSQHEIEKQQALTKIVEAVKNNDEEAAKQAAEALHNSIYQRIKADFDSYQQTQDEKVLSNRGYRQLTSEEKKFYEALGKSVKASDAKQALLDSIPDGAMPTTIIEDVYREIRQEHPLLSKVDFRYVGYLTKWIISDTASQKAVWAKLLIVLLRKLQAVLKKLMLIRTNYQHLF